MEYARSLFVPHSLCPSLILTAKGFTFGSQHSTFMVRTDCRIAAVGNARTCGSFTVNQGQVQCGSTVLRQGSHKGGCRRSIASTRFLYHSTKDKYRGTDSPFLSNLHLFSITANPALLQLALLQIRFFIHNLSTPTVFTQ